MSARIVLDAFETAVFVRADLCWVQCTPELFEMNGEFAAGEKVALCGLRVELVHVALTSVRIANPLANSTRCVRCNFRCSWAIEKPHVDRCRAHDHYHRADRARNNCISVRELARHLESEVDSDLLRVELTLERKINNCLLATDGAFVRIFDAAGEDIFDEGLRALCLGIGAIMVPSRAPHASMAIFEVSIRNMNRRNVSTNERALRRAGRGTSVTQCMM